LNYVVVANEFKGYPRGFQQQGSWPVVADVHQHTKERFNAAVDLGEFLRVHAKSYVVIDRG